MRYSNALGFALAATLIAGCGGGSSSSPIPHPAATNGGNGGSGSTTSASRATVTFQFAIGGTNATSSRGSKRPAFISPNVQSIGVVEQDQTASSASPAVYTNVSSCPTSNGVATCSVSVTAAPGIDTFTLTTYSGQNGGGSRLGTGSLQYQIVAGQANVTTPVTIGGTVASVAFAPAESPLPLGQSAALNLLAKDATGATIIGPYSNPITLSGSSFVYSKTMIVNSSDASSVTVAWANGAISTAQTITATTADNKSFTTKLLPGSGVAFFAVGSNAATDNGGFKMITGPDGKLYFGSTGPTSCPQNQFCVTGGGAVHQYDPATGVTTEINANSEVVGLFFDSHGTLWMAGGPSGTIMYITNAAANFSAANLQTLALPSSGAHNVRALAQDGNNNLWFVDGVQQGQLYKMPLSTPSAANITAYSVPGGPSGTPGWWAVPFGLYYAPDGKLYVMDQNIASIDQFDPVTATWGNQYVTPEQTATGTSTGMDAYDSFGVGNAYYIGMTGAYGAPIANGGLAAFNVSTGAFTQYTLPNFFQQSVGAIATNGNNLYYQDFGTTGLGFVNLSSGKARTIPFIPNGDTNGQYFPNGVTAMSDGTAWFTCYNSTANPVPPLCIGHTVYQNGWSIWPSQNLSVFGTGTQSEVIVGIMEAPSSDSGPFTAVSNDTSVCIVANLSDHNFNVVGQGAGTCQIVVTDAHSVSRTINVGVTVTNATVSSRRHRSFGGI